MLVFAAGIMAGLVMPLGSSEAVSRELESLSELSRYLLSLPPFFTALFIFIRNAIVLVLSFLFSPVLCLVPLLTLFANGSFLSYVAVTVARERSLGFVLAGLLPHGVIEVPAMILGEAAALAFGAGVLLSLFRGKGFGLMFASLRANGKLLLIAIGLLLPAAFVEAFITPMVVGR